ncbi:MAG: SIR2 family protein, partial [Thermodesulfobacteriota bacterium]
MAEIESKPEIKAIGELVTALKLAKGDPARKDWGRAVFLISAGCSRSAGIPLAPEMARSMVCRLAGSLCDATSTAPDDALAQLQKNGHIAEGVRWEDLYGQLFERYFPDPTDQREIILEAVESSRGRINWAHLCLGEMVARGYVHTVLTTNFDQLALDGIIRAGIIPVVADGIEALARVSGRPGHPQVVHLHGSMHTYNPRNSGSAVRETETNPAMQQAIYGLLKDNTLLVVAGYRGNEEGVMSLLIRAAKDLPDKVIYWIAHNPDPDALSPQAKELLGLGRHKYLIPGQDADRFFADIMRGLNLGIPSWMRD